MTPEVVRLLTDLKPAIAAFEKIALLSPAREERALLPRARVIARRDWDLSRPRADLEFDLIVACHVFHYSPEPARWLDNVMHSCSAFLMADLIRRRRSASSEFGLDGDCMRYAIAGHRPVIAGFFDLDGLGASLLAHHVFQGARNEYGSALHLLALIEGHLPGQGAATKASASRRYAPVEWLRTQWNSRWPHARSRGVGSAEGVDVPTSVAQIRGLATRIDGL